MIKTKTFFLLLCIAGYLFATSMVQAAMVFEFDFGQDGTIDSTFYLATGDTTIADLYVSNIPDPGLINMAFTLTYDDSVLQLVPENTAVDPVNWLLRKTDCTVSGQATMNGGRAQGGGLAGDHIKLGTVSFTRIAEEGNVDLTISTREDPNGTVDDFVLEDRTVLDDDLDGGILVASIADSPLFDFDEDGDVDGIDVYRMATCTENCPSLADFAAHFGSWQ